MDRNLPALGYDVIGNDVPWPDGVRGMTGGNGRVETECWKRYGGGGTNEAEGLDERRGKGRPK